MKTLFLTLLLTFTTALSFGHDYFFAFSEIAYNDISRKFESTVIVTTHDLEHVYIKNDSKIDLSTYDPDNKTTDLLQAYFDKHYQIIVNQKKVVLELVGFETYLNGTTNFYFESKPVELKPDFQIRFDVLMNEFPEQQNKTTIYYRNKSYTYSFLSNDKTKTIRLD